ncbi:MAG TPA: pyridoxamine 5'-phosphate oxidase family protein [Nitrososphaera sp.]|nr:pyridoxamine 5'-phosphate oxidase family protein [Nitrososphaera sp.]
MQLLKKYEIQSKHKMVEFLNSQPVGRIASLDGNGYPQIIPMNFVYDAGVIYMHSHPFGEKLDNIRRNPNVGFEVDQHVCFLPSYYFHMTDASQADTLYISVVVKGKAEIVHRNEEKALALNALMEKYQKEGRYQALDASMPSVHEVAIIKVIPRDMRGKYKIGQHWARAYRLKMARNILEREGRESARPILRIMGIDLTADGSSLYVKEEPEM